MGKYAHKPLGTIDSAALQGLLPSSIPSYPEYSVYIVIFKCNRVFIENHKGNLRLLKLKTDLSSHPTEPAYDVMILKHAYSLFHFLSSQKSVDSSLHHNSDKL